jgi:uncharacterized coiled-coil DUF342 family protein
LRGQHQQLLSTVADLRESVELVSPVAPAIDDLGARCRGLVEQLGSHEERENELLCRAVGDEIGAQD